MLRPGASSQALAALTAATATASSSASASASTGSSAPALVSIGLSGGSGQRQSAQALVAQKPAQHLPGQSTQHAVEAQVARGLAAALQQKDGSVTLRLNPENLGFVRIQISVQGGSVEGLIEASSEPARLLLESSLHTLRGALEARGLEVSRLSVGDAGRGDDAQGRGNDGTSAGTDAGGTGERATDDREKPDPSLAARPEAGDGASAEPDAIDTDEGGGGAGPAWDEGADPIGVRLRIDAVA